MKIKKILVVFAVFGALIVSITSTIASWYIGPDGRFEFWLPSGSDYELLVTLPNQGALAQTVPVGDTDQQIDAMLTSMLQWEETP